MGDGRVVVYCKGAPDMIFPMTQYVVDAAGNQVPKDETTAIPTDLL
jgi:hypothetical protein